jgi:hypothetical protein
MTQIFATRHSHSDFDQYVTLVNSRAVVDQFLRWKTSMRAKAILQAECHGFMQTRRPFQPCYLIEPLSESTHAHLWHAVAHRSFP